MGKPDALTRGSDLQGGSRAADAPPHTLLKPGQFIIGALSPTDTSNITVKSDLMAKIEQLQPEDPILAELVPYLRHPDRPVPPAQQGKLKDFSLSNDNIIRYDNKIYIPDNYDLKIDLLHQSHNTPTAGHYGQLKTYQLLSRHYYFPGIRQFTNTYVDGCHTCARNKIPRHKPYGPLQPLPVPAKPWQSISMDAIVKLPSSKGYDSIMVFVDRFTKQAHFIPFKEDGFDAPNLATMFRQHIWRLHGLPQDIVSDRGSIFNSQFW